MRKRRQIRSEPQETNPFPSPPARTAVCFFDVYNGYTERVLALGWVTRWSGRLWLDEFISQANKLYGRSTKLPNKLFWSGDEIVLFSTDLDAILQCTEEAPNGWT